jgi:hypothetical protein
LVNRPQVAGREPDGLEQAADDEVQRKIGITQPLRWLE